MGCFSIMSMEKQTINFPPAQFISGGQDEKNGLIIGGGGGGGGGGSGGGGGERGGGGRERLRGSRGHIMKLLNYCLRSG